MKTSRKFITAALASLFLAVTGLWADYNGYWRLDSTYKDVDCTSFYPSNYCYGNGCRTIGYFVCEELTGSQSPECNVGEQTSWDIDFRYCEGGIYYWECGC